MTDRCTEQVQIHGMQFYRTHQCKRNATVVENGKPLCHQHSAAGQHEIEERKALAFEKRRAQFHSRLRAKALLKKL